VPPPAGHVLLGPVLAPPGAGHRVAVVGHRQGRAVPYSEPLVLRGHPLHVAPQGGQGGAKLQVGAVEEDGDEGVGGAAVGDHLLGEEHRIYLLLVPDVELLLVHHLPPAPPVLDPPEEEYCAEAGGPALHQRLPLQVVDLLHLDPHDPHVLHEEGEQPRVAVQLQPALRQVVQVRLPPRHPDLRISPSLVLSLKEG